MPLIMICGHPSSGKTYRSNQIVEYFTRRIRGEDVDEATNDAEAATAGFSRLSIGTERDNGTSTAGLTEAALSRIAERPTAPANTLLTGPLPSSNTLAPSLPPSKANPQPTTSQQAAPKPKPRRNLRIHHISDHTLSLPRSVYDTSRAEKDARATLYSAVKRAMTRDDIVVLDSGNYIKGWRYQLHCEAKALGTPSCVVHVATTEAEASANNDARLQDQGNEKKINGHDPDDPYEPSTHSALLARFEEPNPHTRWDTPLFTVPLSDPTPPLSRIWEEMVEPRTKDGARRLIRPNQATVLTPASGADHLYVLDRVTQGVLKVVQGWWGEHAEGGGVVSIEMGEVVKGMAGAGGGSGGKVLKVHLPATGPLSVPALQRMRRQFIASHRQQMGGMGMVMGEGTRGGLSAERIAELFVDWLNDQFGQV